MNGYAGKFLRVDLSTGRIQTEELSHGEIMDIVGGRGFALRRLYNEVPPHTDPLGEDNKLFFLTGVLTGTAVVASSRWLATTLSPLSGIYGKSCAGGDFGAWLKFSGFDFVIVEGKAERPVYLYVTPDNCEIRDASGLWGKKTGETQKVPEALPRRRDQSRLYRAGGGESREIRGYRDRHENRCQVRSRHGNGFKAAQGYRRQRTAYLKRSRPGCPSTAHKRAGRIDQCQPWLQGTQEVGYHRGVHVEKRPRRIPHQEFPLWTDEGS